MTDLEKYCRNLKSGNLVSNVSWKGTIGYTDILDFLIVQNSTIPVYLHNYSSLSNALFGLRKFNSHGITTKYIYCIVAEDDIKKGLFAYIQDGKSKELTFDKFYDLEKINVFI
jgi:hypothetical protein